MNNGFKTAPDAKLCYEARYIRCPYNRRHFVWEPKYEIHLQSCGKQYPNINLLFCPFNTAHRCRTMKSLVNSITIIIRKEKFTIEFVCFSRAIISKNVHRRRISESIHRQIRDSGSNLHQQPIR